MAAHERGSISIRLQFGCNRRPYTSRCGKRQKSKGKCPVDSPEDCPLGGEKLARNSQPIVRAVA